MLKEHHTIIKVPSFNCNEAAGIIIVKQFTVWNVENFKH
jgi:hypothetical protein